ncbi:MAG: FAD-dependent oxidoreductase [Planctomycetota bacterium]|nr:FAD-dependent oxidoreductase [Planctomycetota bacterium]
MKPLSILTSVCCCLFIPSCLRGAEAYDVVIYGGTSGAIAAAVQVKRMGKSAIVVCPEKHLGGLTSGGLGWTDSGNKDAIGGISREFYHRVWNHYQKSSAWKWQDSSNFGNRNQSPPGPQGDGATMWVFEPHVAEAIFESLVSEYQIPVHRDRWLDRDPNTGMTKQKGRITAIRMTDGTSYAGKMFIDATYEGDLLAAAGVDYHVGREANSVYDENWNGIQVGVLHHRHHFIKPIDPYIQPGDPSSGVVWGISDEAPGEKGAGDHRIQAYCFRMCLTNLAENRIPFPKPNDYDPSRYELLLRVLDSGWRELFNKFDPLPNRKTDTNNHGPFSTDNIGMNYEYPEATYQQRDLIIKQHENYQKGLMYFMANDQRVPADVRKAMSNWGLAKDEFPETGGWPHQIYVREARRMVGQYVMTEHDCLDRKITPNSIGMGSYTVDSHNVQRYIKPNGKVQNEGDIGVKTPRPYEVAYGAIIPKQEQCENLLVPVCVSSSHIAFGSIRMEPVFMILGQSAATAACLSIDRGESVQQLPYPILRNRLLADRQVLELEIEYPFDSQKIAGTVIDNRNAHLQGNWTASTANRAFVDGDYQHNGNTGNKSANYLADLAPGRYQVSLSYPRNANRATNVPITIHHADGISQASVDQTKTPERDGLFHSIGTYRFDGAAKVIIGTENTDGYVIIDAIQFLKQP